MGSKELKAVFTAFASFGQAPDSKRMNQSNWKKFCEDSDLTDEKFPAGDIALVFAAVKAKGSNDISYEEFRIGLGRVANKKGASPEDVAASVSAAAPKTDGTTQANVAESLEAKTGTIKDHSGEDVLPVPASKDLKVVFTSFAFLERVNIKIEWVFQTGQNSARIPHS